MTTETTTSPTSPTSPPTTGKRASDAEREETVARLHQALAEGRLNLAETDERVAAAYAARHREELPALLADLPEQAVADTAWTSAPTWTELWESAVWRSRAAVLGSRERPTAAQCRSAVWLVVLALVWTAVWAVLGAGLVA